jgi:hypothetical protein
MKINFIIIFWIILLILLGLMWIGKDICLYLLVTYLIILRIKDFYKKI